jgi:hypothetical protein
MTGTGRATAWRRRALMVAFAIMGGLVAIPAAWTRASADETTSLTVLYHGAVTGKIAPCG